MTLVSQKKIEFLMSLRAKMWLAKPKIRQKDIAKKIQRNQSLISHVLSGRKTSALVIRAIQEEIDVRRLGADKFQSA